MSYRIIKNKVYGSLLGGIIGDAMGAPVEAWSYERIVKEKGYINDFEGSGTDDSVIRMILCDALFESKGNACADDFAASFLRHHKDYNWFYIPVRNMYHKLSDELVLPVDAGRDNMASSSSAMAISPIGIVNACNPRGAAQHAYEVAGLIHSGCTNFCRDGAAAVAAAVAEAFRPASSVSSILSASHEYLHPQSAKVMIERIKHVLELAAECESFIEFRKKYYECEKFYSVISDSRETVPVALALFYLAKGDPNLSVEYGANFGRDADTIATIAGSIAGAYAGAASLREGWIDKVENHKQLEQTSDKLIELIQIKSQEKASCLNELKEIM